MCIRDRSNPVAPVVAGRSPVFLDVVQDVKVEGNLAYVADDDAGLQIIDLTNPTAPAAAGSLGGLGTAMGVNVEGNYAYVTTYDSGQFYLRVIDVSDPTDPVQVGSLPTPGYSWNVDVVGQYALSLIHI